MKQNLRNNTREASSIGFTSENGDGSANGYGGRIKAPGKARPEHR